MTEESIEIIRMLREARLGWIADELVESLALGRQTFKEFREPGAKRNTRATSIEPLSPEEEMELVVETLAQYFIIMPRAWRIARSRFSKEGVFTEIEVDAYEMASKKIEPLRPNDTSAQLGIAGDGEEPFQEFSAAYNAETIPALKHVLRKLWPRGANDFDRNFEEEAK